MEHIRIQTFGKFEITFNGEVYRLEKSQSTKTAHLLQFLTVNQGKSFEKSALVDILYEDGEVSDPLNNLKVNIFRLRQMLERSGLPGDKFILHRKGCYSWNPEITLNLDVDEFRRLLDHAARTDLPREDRIALMTAALDLYQGEFLPGLRGERWVEVIDTDCRQRYLDAVEFVDSYCCESDNFELEDRILRQAVSFFPYEEKVRAMQLRSLINRKMYREAMALYEENGGEIDKAQIAKDDLEALSIPSETSRNLALPSVGAQGSVITWEVTAGTAMDNNGVITRPEVGEPDAEVTLTAPAVYGYGKLVRPALTMTKFRTVGVCGDRIVSVDITFLAEGSRVTYLLFEVAVVQG